MSKFILGFVSGGCFLWVLLLVGSQWMKSEREKAMEQVLVKPERLLGKFIGDVDVKANYILEGSNNDREIYIYPGEKARVGLEVDKEKIVEVWTW